MSIHAPGIAALRRWGLLDAVVADGLPADRDATRSTSARSRSPARRGRTRGSRRRYAPRRTVLDEILVDAARRPEPRCASASRSTSIVVEDGTVVGIRGRGADGTAVVERARVVIGADGRNSRVAKAVGAGEYHEKPRLQWSYYSYWSGLPVDGFEIFVRPDRGWAAAPTNDGLTMLVVGWPFAEAQAYKTDIEANYLKTLELAPEFAERVRGATRVERFGGGAVRNFFRTPFGPGWALVGDAGYNKDPITAQGIGDAFRDAELCAAALGRGVHGRDRLRRRDGRLPACARRPRVADLRVHGAAGDAGGPAARRCSSCSAPSQATRTRWTHSSA